MKRHSLQRGAALLLTLAAVAACQSSPGAAATPAAPPGLTYQISLPVSHPPFDTFHPSWVTRLEEGYVFMEHFGSYTDTGAHIPAVLREMKAQGIEPSGPPFCLFYDDPAATPRAQLRSRACVPIEGARSPRAPLYYDVLPTANVAYAYVSGPYPEVPRAYPKLFEYMARFGWVANGPIREEYIVPPGQAKAPSDHICQIQIPYAPGER